MAQAAEIRRAWWHRSVFGDGDRAPLDAGRLAAWKWRVRAAGAAGRLNANGLAVADALASYLGPDGRLDPSYEAIAERCRQRGVRLARRTLARCLVRLRELGAVSWQPPRPAAEAVAVSGGGGGGGGGRCRCRRGPDTREQC